jgi:two-component system nitrogen regulation response regulator GlnG
LFGHEAGAFSGATRSAPGFFLQAEDSTLFLDEVGETPRDVQTMLLRALETGEIQSVGSRRTRHADVRVIAATDSDLEKAVLSGRFSEPLLHRLGRLVISVPRLAERRVDIIPLFVRFLVEACAHVGADDPLRSGEDDWLPVTLLDRLLSLQWPGNARQLRNIADQIAVSNRAGGPFRWTSALDTALERAGEVAFAASKRSDRGDGATSRPTGIDDAAILGALEAHDFAVRAAARELGWAPTTLYKRIEASATLPSAQKLTLETIERALDVEGGDRVRAARRLKVSPRALGKRLKDLT